MKSISLIAMAVSIGFAVPAYSALPPQYQRTVELKAILDRADIAETFIGRGHLIEQIEYVSPDLYRVTGGNCALDAAIVEKPLPEGMVGARQFDVKPGTITCTGEASATDGEAN